MTKSSFPVIHIGHETTAQDVYEAVAKHMLAQGTAARSPLGNCQYRLSNLACAVGCLMTDDEAYAADNAPRGISMSSLIEQELLPERLYAQSDLLFELQKIHDTNEPSAWKWLLEEFPSHRPSFGLTVPEFLK